MVRVEDDETRTERKKSSVHSVVPLMYRVERSLGGDSSL